MRTSVRKPRSSRAARQRREEGAVMLVVMLILMIATAGAAISVQSTASEVNAAGQERLGLQSKYASEAAMMTTITWIDRLVEKGQWIGVWQYWKEKPVPPTLPNYAEPAIDVTHRHHASRSTMEQQLANQTTDEIPPLSVATTGSGGASGSGGTGSGGSGPVVTPFSDPLGSFGPRQAYVPQAEGYVVDINDCARAPSGTTPGTQVDSGAGGAKFVQFYCVLTAHMRVELAGGNIPDTWLFGTADFTNNWFTNYHDSRATILTPPVPDDE